MLLTEDEAKTKWCPFAFTFGSLHHFEKGAEVGRSFGPQNRGYQMGGPLDSCRCIASLCMAWRWQDPFNLEGRDDAERHGFCGLSGEMK